jgi:hypothetical protein
MELAMKFSLTAAVLATVGIACLTGCSRPAEPLTPPAAITPVFNTSVPLNEVMAHVMNPAAFNFWSGWGTSYTVAGEIDLSPKNEAEWKRVEDGAITVLTTTNVIKLPGYVREPQADWIRYADKVAEVATRAKDAAERQNKNDLGSIGAELDEACEACHSRFIANYGS